jgi:hypothetical protein
LRLANSCPARRGLTWPKRWKSEGAVLGEYGGCGALSIAFHSIKPSAIRAVRYRNGGSVFDLSYKAVSGAKPIADQEPELRKSSH